MSYVNHTELDEIIVRFQVFLSKLEQRAIELEDDTIQAAQVVIEQDEIRYIHFRAGIVGQFDSLKSKAREIFEIQILKKSNRNYINNRDIFLDNELQIFEQKINDAERKLNEFEERINIIVENIFNKVKSKSPQEKLQEILDDYEVNKENFCCKQCGAKLRLKQIFFVSTYVNCDYCQTQNTFIPSMKLALLPDLVKEIALHECGELEYPIIGNNLSEQFKRYEEYSRKMFFIKKDLIPQLTESYRSIYKRELSDFMLGNTFETSEYQQIISQFSVKSIQPLLLQYKQNESTFNNQDQLKTLENIKYNILLNIDLLNSVFMEESAEKISKIKELEKLNIEIQELITLKKIKD